MSARGPGVRVAALRVLLRLLPRKLREEHGESVLETFESAWRDRRTRQGRLAAHRFTVRTALDLFVTGARERTRALRIPFGSGLGRDLRHSLRVLARSPGFAVSALLVLSLGIGVNAAIFTALRAVVLQGPPYPDADRTVVFGLTIAPDDPSEISLWSYPKLRLLSEMESPRIENVAGFTSRVLRMEVDGESVRTRLELASHGYLSILGARPALGRLYAAEDDDPASPQLVGVLSHEFWLSTFGGDPSVIGRTVPMGQGQLRVIGVLDSSFEGLTGEIDLWVPLTSAALLFSPLWIENATMGAYQAIGRLAPDASLEEARSWAAAAVQHVQTTYPPRVALQPVHANVNTIRDARTHPEARVAVLAMAAAALMVLLVGCANLAGLQIARGASRRHELAVRTSLGATRPQLVRQLLVESLVLAGVGGALGVTVARYGVHVLRGQWPSRFGFDPTGHLRSFDPEVLSLDPVAVLFALAVTITTALLFGPLPALRLSGTGFGDTLKSNNRSSTSGGARSGLGARGALIAGEVALAFVLLVGATLITTTMLRLLSAERGFETKGLLTFELGLPEIEATAEAGRVAALIERLSSHPSVAEAAVGCIAPMSGRCMDFALPVNGGAVDEASQQRVTVGLQPASDRYFETLGARIVAGRSFAGLGGGSAEPVVVINEAVADALYRDRDPIGQLFPFPALARQEPATVIGVVENILKGRPQDGAEPEAYVPLAQWPFGLGDGVAFVRSSEDPDALLPVLARELQALEPEATVSNPVTGADLLARVTTDTRSVLWLIGVFAGAAVFLAALGIWSVVAYTVAQRRRELGIRMALGARAHQVVVLVARSGAAAAAIGVLLGVGGAYATSRLLASLLFGVAPNDPMVVLIAVVVFTGIGGIASALPALRATRVDPVQAMRVD